MAKKKEIKFTKEELSSLQSLKESYSNIELSFVLGVSFQICPFLR